MAFGPPKKIEVKYDAADIQNMISLLKAAPFPDKASLDAEPWKLGIEYGYLKELVSRFETSWSWSSLEKQIAQYDNYLVHYENGADSLDLHYIYVRSSRSDAIPLFLLHGWPGTFFDFHKVIEPLTNPSDAKHPAFHVVVPSIPGYFLSTLPRRHGFNLSDIATVYNGLMTEILGYKQYAAQGGDWGAFILRVMGSLFPGAIPALHFNMFRAPVSPGSDPSKYSEVEKRIIASRTEFRDTGRGYSAIQGTKPFTIGLAIASSPLALLAYIGEKMYAWSDPERLSQQDIIDTVALYWLSKSFPTSVVIYNQGNDEREILANEPSKFRPKGKIGFSAFPYEVGGSPRIDIEAIGNLVYYKEHTGGGHFPALDSPNEYVEDVREFFGLHWTS